jgi:hypothetical protein
MFNLKRFLLLGSLGAVMMASFLALPMVTGQSVAHAHARIALSTPNCTRTANDQDGNFVADIPSTSSSDSGVNCIVGLNDDSPAVGALQTSMNHCYASVIEHQLTVDNIYGQATMEAMEDVQAAIGHISVDGTYGPQTRGAGFQFFGAFIQHPHAGCAPDLN